MLHLPDGLEIVGHKWFITNDIWKVIVPSSVKILGESAFSWCVNLREVVFEPYSQLERIEKDCFYMCDLREIVIPRSVHYIEDHAF